MLNINRSSIRDEYIKTGTTDQWNKPVCIEINPLTSLTSFIHAWKHCYLSSQYHLVWPDCVVQVQWMIWGSCNWNIGYLYMLYPVFTWNPTGSASWKWHARSLTRSSRVCRYLFCISHRLPRWFFGGSFRYPLSILNLKSNRYSILNMAHKIIDQCTKNKIFNQHFAWLSHLFCISGTLARLCEMQYRWSFEEALDIPCPLWAWNLTGICILDGI